MKTIIIHIVFIMAALFYGCKPRVAEIHVSVSGKEGNSGAIEAPLPSIHSALEAANTIREGDPGIKISIVIAPGRYFIDQPVVIPPALNDLSLTGAGSSQVTICGSSVIQPVWEKYDDSIFVCKTNETLSFDQLVVNGNMQILARYPNYNEQGGHLQGHSADALSPGRIKTWKNPAGTIFNAVHAYEWGDFHYTITGIDPDGQPILAGGHQNNRPAPAHPVYRMVENVFEELDAPGEWYLDTQKHLLFYRPEKNIDMQTAVFEVVTLKNLLTIQGSEETPVRNISIRGIKFQYTRRTIMEPYEPLLRSDWSIYRGGAIYIEGAEDCTISECEFTNLGGNAVFVSGYNRNVNITENHIHECGASGVCFVGNPSAVRSPSFQYQQFVPLDQMDTVKGPLTNSYPKDCTAGNNLIYRTGRIEKQTAGVQISMSMNITVSHNSIYDVPRAGINIGDGTWGGHVLEFNDVFNTVLESGDHGSFNSWGRDRYWHPNRNVMDSISGMNPQMPYWDAIHTTIIRNNRFRCDHGWDIDLDDGSSNYHIYNNLCLNGGLKLREGFYRLVENNIMVNNSFHPHVWFKNSGDIFRKNIVMAAYKDIRLDGWGKELDFNLFPDEPALLKAQEHGVDANSTYGNPHFRSPEEGDFSVHKESPAIRLGFVNFPMDDFGVKNPELKKITKTPELPVLRNMAPDVGQGAPVQDWQGARIKNIETLEERSASGLGKTAGVFVISVEKNSRAEISGLRKGDVIIGAGGQEVNTIIHLMKNTEKRPANQPIKLRIFRNQDELVLELNSAK